MKPINLKQLVARLEERAILRALAETEHNRQDAADLLGLKRTTFVMKCKKYGVDLKRSPMDRRNMTHCFYGHPFVEGNLYYGSSKGRVTRRCATCVKASKRAEYAEMKAETARRRAERAGKWTGSQNS